MTLDWQADALCRDLDPELFFPDQDSSRMVATAKRWCERCPVKAQCLDLALANGEQFGVWGGTTPGERHNLRRAAARRSRTGAA